LTNASYARQIESQLKQHCAGLWDRPAAAIDTETLIEVLTPIWSKYPVAAQRVCRMIKGVLERANFLKWRSGENPARWKGHLELQFVGRRETDIEQIGMIALEDVPAYARDLRAKTGPAFRCLELLLLTAVRSHDVRNAKWDDIDLLRDEWRIPKASKIGKPVTIPLSGRACELLKSMPRAVGTIGSDYLFAGEAGKPLDPRVISKTMARLRPGLSPHSSRSSFKSWATTRQSFPPDVVEEALLHTVGGKVERGYSRLEMLEKRRHLMDAWAAFCSAPAARAASVIPLRTRKR
jgi:integrase